MEKKILYCISLLFMFSVIMASGKDITSSMGFKVCNDGDPHLSIRAKYDDGHVEPKFLSWHECKTFPWAEVTFDSNDYIKNTKKLDRVSIYSESKGTNDNFFRHSFFFDFRHVHTSDSVFIGRITNRGLCDDSLSKLLYTIHASPALSYHLKNFHYTITVHIKGDQHFNPEGNLQKYCNFIDMDRKNNTISAWCRAPIKGHVQKYFFVLKGIDTLEALNKTSLWSTSNGFVNTCGKAYRIGHKKVIDCKTSPGGGESISLGSYAKSCIMRYFDTKNNVLYAACPTGKPFIRLYNYGHYWYIKNNSLNAPLNQLVYTVSKLDLNKHKHCKDIINKNGKLTCLSKG